MKLMTWAVGSVLISLMLALVVAAAVSAAPAVAAELACPHARAAAHAGQKPAHSAPAAGRRSYFIATRMGWAIS